MNITSGPALQRILSALYHEIMNFKLFFLLVYTKITVFKGKHLVRSKLEIEGSILEQVRNFNYLGCEMSLEGEPDFDQKK